MRRGISLRNSRCTHFVFSMIGTRHDIAKPSDRAPLAKTDWTNHHEPFKAKGRADIAARFTPGGINTRSGGAKLVRHKACPRVNEKVAQRLAIAPKSASPTFTYGSCSHIGSSNN